MTPPGIRLAWQVAGAALLLAGLLLVSGPLAAQSDSSGADSTQKARLVDFWRPGDVGERMNIRGRVTSLDGTPLPGVQISIRQADGDGDYSERYRGVLTTDDKGRFQFGSVVPGNYTGARHVHVTVYQSGWEYFDTSILFKDDPNQQSHYDYGTAIFLEESTVNGETIKFGRFDIELTPE